MSLASPATPTLKPTNPNSIKNIPILKDINNADNLLESQEKSQENIEPHISGRKRTLKSTKMSPSVYIKLINQHPNIYEPMVNEEAMENINIIKDYKWKLGMVLTDKINSLKFEINEKRKEIENKKKEFAKKNVYPERIKYLNKLIRKEEDERYWDQNNTNTKLKEKKKELENQINEIETNKKNLKATMKKKYQTMLELKDNLNKSLKELLSVEKQINSKKFILEQEEFEKEKERKRQMSQKLFRKDEELLHLSQNIGDYINQNLLLKDDSKI